MIERLFWSGRGIGIEQVIYLEIIYAVTVSVLEIPTGYWADRWSRKWLMVGGGFFTCLELLILIYAWNFWSFALAMISAGIAKAATSGTANALLYDSLQQLEQTRQFERILGRIRSLDYLAGTLAALIGSWVAARYGLVTTYWLSLGSVIVSFGSAWALTEPTARTSAEPRVTQPRLVSRAWQFLLVHRELWTVMSYGVITGVCLSYLDEFWQLYLDGFMFPLGWFGVVSSVNRLGVSLGSWVAHRFQRRSLPTLFTLLLGLMAAGFIAMAGLGNSWGVLVMVGIYGAAGIVEPLVAGYCQHRIPSEIRATVESFQSLAFRIVTIPVGLGFGYIARQAGVQGGLLALGGLLGGYWVLYQIKLQRRIR